MSRPRNVEIAAEKALEGAILHLRGRPVGTVASLDDSVEALNYDECFTRDFAVSAVAFLLEGRHEIVRHFLEVLVELQSSEKHMDCFRPGLGLMPASFGVREQDGREQLEPDFGERAIARVAPVDSGLWWLILLRAYVETSGHGDLARRPEFQRAIERNLDLFLTPKFEMFPTLLVPDGAYMIDRRMGVYGHPLDLQALFFGALRSASELLDSNSEYLEPVETRIGHLLHHVRSYYWLDFDRLNEIYRYRQDEFGADAVNKFNVVSGGIPTWSMEWLPLEGGYFAGNLGPARMDFRFFAQGNLMAILTSLATPEQADAIMTLIENRWDDLVGQMPMKVAFPALEGRDWELMTGFDAKNVPWSYHNGGSWPFLLWLLAAAARKTGRIELASRAVEVASRRLQRDDWPEYYDGRDGRLVGKQARKKQAWTIAGFLAARRILESRGDVSAFGFVDQPEVAACTLPWASESREEDEE